MLGARCLFQNQHLASNGSAQLRFKQQNSGAGAGFCNYLELCRNVLIYFDQTLQTRVHQLLYGSLINFGMLGLGQMESIRFSPYESCYETRDSTEKWYSKVR